MRDAAYSNFCRKHLFVGFFYALRTELWDAIEWFDERFFMYLEDADLTRRLSKFGKCFHNPLK